MNGKFYIAPDGYVKVPLSALCTVQLDHLVSAIDLSIAVPEGITAEPAIDLVTGFTEWVGWFQQMQISVGWDWGVVHDAIVVLDPAEIRTNVQIANDDGSVMSSVLGRYHILEWIETLSWRKYVMPEGSR